jgi:hypothetical protein
LGIVIACHGLDFSQVYIVKPIGWVKLVVLLGFAIFTLSAAAASCVPENFDGIEVVGVAHDLEGELLYCEWHKPLGESQMLVEYRTAEGQVFASKELVFDDDGALPQVIQIDKRSGEHIQVQKKEGSWDLNYQKNQQAKSEQTQVSLQQVDVIDAGFDHKVRASWDALMAGEKLRIRFAAPALQRVVPLRVMRKEDEGCALMQADWHCIWVEADNGLIRLFVDPLQLAYDGERRLRVFSGVVNIRDSAGNKQTAVIEYVYAGEKK